MRTSARGTLPRAGRSSRPSRRPSPRKPSVPTVSASLARAEKNGRKALAYFEDALSKKPTAIEPLAQIAMIKIAQGKSSEARERVSKQLDASPNNPLLYNLLGQLWIQAKNTGQAGDSFQEGDRTRQFPTVCLHKLRPSLSSDWQGRIRP